MIDETMFEAEEKMDKATEVLKEDFAGIRTGRANPGLFNKLLVDYYGAPTPLQQLASFQNPEPRTILVIPFDKSAMREIEKAIRTNHGRIAFSISRIAVLSNGVIRIVRGLGLLERRELLQRRRRAVVVDQSTC